MYEIILTDKVKSQLKKLSSDSKNRIGKALEKIRIRPHHFVKRVVGTKFFRLRVGNYRVILDIKNNDFIIYAIEIGNRKNIYKK